MSRVLFVHPRKRSPEVTIPHMGLASLAAMLLREGHEVTVLDEVLYPQDRVPDLAAVIAERRPDVIGVSSYTATLDRLMQTLTVARSANAAPILVGGPHATIFPEHLAATGLVDYVVQGEAEDLICGLVSEAQRREQAAVIRGEPPDVQSLPWPNYTCTLNWQTISTYPIMTSRGCPYSCSFCVVHQLTSRRWRPRDPADCAAEIAAARERFPALVRIEVSDDCPAADPEHLKRFLRLLGEQPPILLLVDNLRADQVDDELLSLMKAAGAETACLGVEHGHPEVFELIGKRETIEDIRKAAMRIKRHGLDLGLCFIIGLPGDTLSRTRASIRLAKELNPKYIFWNQAHPFPGTAMYRWFLEHGGSIDPPRAYTSYDFHWLRCEEPVVETPEFSKWERQRAYCWAVLETDQYMPVPGMLRDLLASAWRYRMPGTAIRSLVRRTIRRSLRRFGQWLCGLGAPSKERSALRR